MATPPMLDERPLAVGRHTPPDPVVAIAVGLVALTAVGLLIGAFLAAYDWRTPGAMAPTVVVLTGLFSGAIVLLVLALAVRWVRSGAPR